MADPEQNNDEETLGVLALDDLIRERVPGAIGPVGVAKVAVKESQLHNSKHQASFLTAGPQSALQRRIASALERLGGELSDLRDDGLPRDKARPMVLQLLKPFAERYNGTRAAVPIKQAQQHIHGHQAFEEHRITTTAARRSVAAPAA